MKISALVVSLVLLLLPAVPAAASPGGSQLVAPANAKKAKKRCKRARHHGRHAHRPCRKRGHARSPVTPVTPVAPSVPSSSQTTPIVVPATPTTIYSINQGEVAPGTKAAVPNALVTGVAAAGDAIWIASKPGDEGYAGEDFSGLEVDVSALATKPAIGDRVTVEGTARSTPVPGLVADHIAIETSAGETMTPYAETATAFVNPANAARLNGVLVRLETLYQVEDLGAEWLMVDDTEPEHFLKLSDRLSGSFPSFVYNEFSVRGIADTLGSGNLLPTVPGDVLELGP